ncbi:hypothetical protein CEXT_685181, partial [Caerostris extrusa]
GLENSAGILFIISTWLSKITFKFPPGWKFCIALQWMKVLEGILPSEGLKKEFITLILKDFLISAVSALDEAAGHLCFMEAISMLASGWMGICVAQRIP